MENTGRGLERVDDLWGFGGGVNIEEDGGAVGQRGGGDGGVGGRKGEAVDGGAEGDGVVAEELCGVTARADFVEVGVPRGKSDDHEAAVVR